jgi:hypothetical protein
MPPTERARRSHPARAGARRRKPPSLAALATAVLVTASACGIGDDTAIRERPATSAVPSDRPTSTSRPPSTTAAEPAPSIAGSVPTTLPATAPVIDGTGAVLTRPASPVPVPVPPGDPCNVLADAATAFECSSTLVGNGELVWSVEQLVEGVPGVRVSVFSLLDGLATEVLAFDDDAGVQFAHATAVQGDVDGHPGEELVVGFRSQGSSAFLELDVVSGQGSVVAHRSLDHGRAALAADGLSTWVAQFGPDDDNCCPGVFVAERLTFVDSQWRLTPSTLVPADQVPPGDFP